MPPHSLHAIRPSARHAPRSSTRSFSRRFARLAAPLGFVALGVVACGSGESPRPTGGMPAGARFSTTVSVDQANGHAPAGAQGFTTLPAALSRGNGDFDVKSTVHADFVAWAAQPNVTALNGDFNHDGLTDVALIGGDPAWWHTMPVAFANGDGSFRVTNSDIGRDFAAWAATPNVSVLAGDFDADGRTDVALIGGDPAWWHTMPVAFSNGDGSFRITNADVSAFAQWAAVPNVKRLVGDFDGDRRADVALIGGDPNWWVTMPVAFSNGDGTFRATNQPVGDFAAWAAVPNVQAITGDFNNDHRTDLALIGGDPNWWHTMPVAFSAGDGSFTITNADVGPFAAWAATPNAKVLGGDYNGDGRTDVALTGGGWTTLPVAFSNGNGGFNITNAGVGDFAKWAAVPNAKALTGDFDGDGRTDVALTGGDPNWWTTMPVAFSRGDGTFGITNGQVGDFARWAGAPDSRALGGDFNGDGLGDVMLLGGEPAMAYNKLRQKSSHNAYERDEALLDQMVYHRIRSLEFDIHNGKDDWPKVPEDWYVYHDGWRSKTSCHRLSDCLGELRAFHLANPDHEVVTVFIDLKDSFEADRMPDQLDALIQRHLPPEWVFRPSQLRDACPGAQTLKAAVTGDCAWPTHLQLRGRFIFALTGSDLSAGSKLFTYAADDQAAHARLAFVAPDLKRASGVARAQPHAVFFNINASYAAVANDVHAAGFVGRVWDVNDESTWRRVAVLDVNHIGTDNVNHLADPWAVTHNPQGWPFQCLDGLDCAGLREPVPLFGIEATSGDIWGRADSFMFAHEYTEEPGVGWNASVATPNSHVEEWGKGCLMARASLEARAPYVAICRAADEHKLRMQYRTAAGGPTTAVEVDIVPADTIDQESLTFIALDVNHDGARTCANAYGSQSNEGWRLIRTVCVNGRLPYQGLAVSSHGSGPLKMLFSNLRRNEVVHRAFPAAAPVGAGASGRAFEGFAP